MFKKICSKFIHFIRSLYDGGLFPVHKACSHRFVGLVTLGIGSCLLPHLPNCTAINAIALFGICSLGNVALSLFTVFTTLLLKDLCFGFHSSMLFVYLSFGLITLMGYGLKSKRSLLRSTCLLALSALLFFIVTNFGVWFGGSIYPKTVAGLGLCYLAAIPFFANNLISTLLYGGVLFGWLYSSQLEKSNLDHAKAPGVIDHKSQAA